MTRPTPHPRNHPAIRQAAAVICLVTASVVLPTACNRAATANANETAPARPDGGSDTTPARPRRGGRAATSPATSVLAAQVSSAPLLKAPWTSYFGAQDRLPQWGRFLRGAGNEAVGAERRPEEFQAAVQQALVASDVVMVPVSGLESARDANAVRIFVEQIRTSAGRSAWQTAVTTQAAALLRLPDARERLVWQIGNEINSRHYSTGLAPWTRGVGGVRNGEEVIPAYVEFFLAPGIEAIREANRQVLGDEAASRIALGSVTNSATPAAHRWLTKLLAYTITGEYAPSLRGKRVADLVDVVTIHYVASAANVRWREALETITAAALGNGRVQGVWSTEEGGTQAGQQNRGATFTLRIFGRYVHWWATKGLTPDQSRTSIYGGRMGTEGSRGEDAMSSLLAFLGHERLRDLTIATASANPGAETYAFERSNADRRVVIALPQGRPIGELRLPAAGWNGPVAASLEVYRTGSVRKLNVRGQLSGGSYIFPLNSADANGDALLLKVSRQ